MPNPKPPVTPKDPLDKFYEPLLIAFASENFRNGRSDYEHVARQAMQFARAAVEQKAKPAAKVVVSTGVRTATAPIPMPDPVESGNLAAVAAGLPGVPPPQSTSVPLTKEMMLGEKAA